MGAKVNQGLFHHGTSTVGHIFPFQPLGTLLDDVLEVAYLLDPEVWQQDTGIMLSCVFRDIC